MKRVIMLATALLCADIPAQAAGVFTQSEQERSPYTKKLNQRLQLLGSMSKLLYEVRDTTSADTAAPRLLRKAAQFQQLQEELEKCGVPAISKASQLRYVQQMEHALNIFRLVCLRVTQEKCYGSAALRQAIGKISQSF